MAEQKKRRQIDDIHDRKHQEIAALFSGTAVRYGFKEIRLAMEAISVPSPPRLTPTISSR